MQAAARESGGENFRQQYEEYASKALEDGPKTLILLLEAFASQS